MKKVISVLMILILAGSIFVGCASTEEAPVVETPAVEEPAEAVTTASIVDNAEAFVNALSADGAWIAASLTDITLKEDLIVEGEFTNKEKVARKIAIYTQDADHNIIDSFTLTAPKMIVRSENLKLQGGTFVGDIYVEAAGFRVSKATVEGNVYFATQELMDAAIADDSGIVTGAYEVMASDTDVITTASIVDNAEAFVNALSADGAWIAASLTDITLTEDLIVEGEFTNKEKVARKIAIYTQDADHNIIDSFTLTAPKMIVRSENLKLQGGTFVGDIYVEAAGFRVSKATVEGNVYFATQELMDAAIADDSGIVTGAYEVK
jgi:hypothetical protein